MCSVHFATKKTTQDHLRRPSFSRMNAQNSSPMTTFGLLFLSFLLINVVHTQEEVRGGGEGSGGSDSVLFGGGGGGGQDGRNTL